MNKIFIVIVLCTIGLNAQSKLLPILGGPSGLEQTLKDNTLILNHLEHNIDKVILYHKKSLELTTYENASKRIDINLNEIQSGLYTGMVYVKGDIIVFNVDVKASSKKNKSTESLLEEIDEKTIKYYRVISSVFHGLSKFNVFNEKRKNAIIRKNIHDIKSYTGRKNTVVIYAVYTDNTEQIIYETPAKKGFDLFEDAKVIAKTN